MLRRLEAMRLAVDRDHLLLVSGTGDVIQPTDGIRRHRLPVGPTSWQPPGH